MKVWSDRGSTCKFRNARSAFRNLHVDPLSLHTFMRNKQVEFNPYIYTLTTLSKLYRFGTKYPFFNTKHPVIILRVSLFAVTPSHVASTKIECQNCSYVYRSRKHWECKYLCVYIHLADISLEFSETNTPLRNYRNWKRGIFKHTCIRPSVRLLSVTKSLTCAKVALPYLAYI